MDMTSEIVNVIFERPSFSICSWTAVLFLCMHCAQGLCFPRVGNKDNGQ